jgi:hypothetical protein
MRTLGILVICLTLLAQVAEAKQTRSSPVKVVAVETVLKAGPRTDGKAYLLELQLKNGGQVAYQFASADADKVANGLRKPIQAKYLDVLSIQYGVDRQRQCVILIPQTREHTLDGLCFPLTHSDQLIERLKMEFAQLRPEVAEVQQKQFAPVKAVTVQKVVKAGAEADGKAFRLELQLKNGGQVAYQFAPADADEVSKGLSNPVIKAVQGKVNYSLVWGLHTEVDPQRQRVVLSPQSEGRTLDSLGLPLTAKDNLIGSLQDNFALLKAGAAKQGGQPNQPAQPARPAQPAQQK